LSEMQSSLGISKHASGARFLNSTAGAAS